MAEQTADEVHEVVLTGVPRNFRGAGTDITSLTASWKEVLGGDLAVIHDAATSRGQAAQLASGVFEAIRKHDRLLQWSRRVFQVAFIHCATKSTPIEMTANAIHFYEPESEVDPELGWQIFDSLSEKQQEHYAELCPGDVQARMDFGRSILASYGQSDPRIAGPAGRMMRYELKGDKIQVMDKDGIVQEVILVDVKTPELDDYEPRRVLEVDSLGRRWVRIKVPNRPSAAEPQAASERVDWDDIQNQRRCDLIDKEIEGTITDQERIELSSLHARLRQYLDEVAPVAIEGARKLHEQLLEKKGQLQLRS